MVTYTYIYIKTYLWYECGSFNKYYKMMTNLLSNFSSFNNTTQIQKVLHYLTNIIKIHFKILKVEHYLITLQ